MLVYFGAVYINKSLYPKIIMVVGNIRFSKSFKLLKGNFEIIEYLTKSVYRFMARMENLTVVEEEMFKFLRHSFHVSRNKLKSEFEKFLQKNKQFEKSRFETRAFAYLDIISWVESKVLEKPMNEILREKYLNSPRIRTLKAQTV